jgi:hypothetical protein
VTAWNHGVGPIEVSLRVSNGPPVSTSLRPGERAEVEVPVPAGPRLLEVGSETVRCRAFGRDEVGVYIESIRLA